MMGILRANAKALGHPDPTPIVSLGGTDARLWRQRGIPALVHGTFPRGMAQADEHVEIDEFLRVVRMHVLSRFDYLWRGAQCWGCPFVPCAPSGGEGRVRGASESRASRIPSHRQPVH